MNINEGLRVRPGIGAARPASRPDTKERLILEIQEAMAASRAGAFRQGFHNLLGRSVSMTHMHVLAKLRVAGPLPMTRLSEALDVSVASATGIVSRMEERGLVARSRDDADRRIVLVAITDGGSAALEEIEARGREQFGRLLRELTKGELVQLRNGFRAIHRARQKLAGDEPRPEGERNHG